MPRLALILFLLCPALAGAFTTNSATKEFWTDASFTDVTNAFVAGILNQAEDGWAIVLGTAGATATWASTYNFTGHAYDWTMKGTNEVFADRPVITCNAVGARGAITFTGDGSAGATVTIQDISWRTVDASDIDPIVTVTGDASPHNFIVQRCDFLNTSGSGNGDRCIFATAYGLIDDCWFPGEEDNRIWVTDHVDNRWLGHMTWGSVSNVVIENCRADNTTETMGQFLDGDLGMRAILRYCSLTNFNSEQHGCTSALEPLHCEVYANQWWLNGSSSGSADWALHTVRGGTAWIYSNHVARPSGSQWWGFNHLFKMWAEQQGPATVDYQPGTGLVSLDTIGIVPVYEWQNTWWKGPTGTYVPETIGPVCGGGSPTSMTHGTHYYTNGTTPPNFVQLTYPYPRTVAAPAATITGGAGISGFRLK